MTGAAKVTGMRNTGRWLVIAAILVAIDQLTKYVVVQNIATGSSIPVLPFFSLILTHNTGAAFSFLAGASGWQRWFFAVIAVAASALIVWMLRRHHKETFLCVGLTLILSGAIGNLIDRVMIGAVVDFILLYWRSYSWPAFNVADSCISIGAAMLIWDSLRQSRKARD